MEKNFDVKNEVRDGERIFKLNNDETYQPPYGTLTTIYYSCDSNLFKSSESSVQVVSANNNYNAPVGHPVPNFCELDIVTKKEKLKSNVDVMPLQTITEELKSLPMTKNTKNPGHGFRKKVYHKTVGGDEPVEVLRLATILKDDETIFTPIQNRSKELNIAPEKKVQIISEEIEEKKKVDEISQTKKKSRSTSRRRKAKDEPQQNLPVEIPVNILPSQNKYADLGTAKTMYFVELPNVVQSSDQKQDSVNAQPVQPVNSEKPKKKRLKHSKLPKESLKIPTEPQPITKGELSLGDIIINKVENEFPPVSSPGSLTTVPSLVYKKHSDISFGSIEIPKSTKTDFRRRTNSPNTEDTFLEDFLRKHKTDTTVYKGKYRKKHRTSPKLSSGEESAGKHKNLPNQTKKNQINLQEQQQQPEVKVIYQVDNINTRDQHVGQEINKKLKHHTQNRKLKINKDELPVNKPELLTDNIQIKPEKKHRSKSRKKCDKDAPEIIEDVQEKNKKEKKGKTKEEKASPRIIKNEDSVVNLYVANKTLQSESCTIIGDEEFLQSPVKKSGKSRRSKSRSASPSRKSSRTKTIFVAQPIVLKEDILLGSVEDRKTKQRSKSRAADEKCQKAKHKSKLHKKKNIHELTKRISRKSASDLSRKSADDCDGHRSFEEEHKSGRSRDKNHRNGSLNRNKDKNKIDLINHVSVEVPKEVEKSEIGETIPYQITAPLVYHTVKEKRKRSKSYVPKHDKVTCNNGQTEKSLASSKSHIFEGSSRSSETTVVKRLPRSKKSKSYVYQNRNDSYLFAQTQESSFKREMYDDVSKVSTIQNFDATRKRFRVISKTIRSKTSDGSTTQSADQSYFNRKFTGIHKFKALMPSEKEKEAILKLPIFNKDFSDCAVKHEMEEFEEIEENTVKQKTSIKAVKHDYYETSEMEEIFIKEEKMKRKKRIRKPTFRREVSFSHLNVSPVMDLYKKPSRQRFPKKILPPERNNRKCLQYPTATIQLKPKDVPTHSEIISEETDFSMSKNESIRKLNSFTIILGEKILEIYTKAIGKDGHISEGFTVSGSEPPKRFRSTDGYKDQLKLMALATKLHVTFLPPIEIVDGVLKQDQPLQRPFKELNEISLKLQQSIGTTNKISSEATNDDNDNYQAVEIKDTKNELIQADARETLPSKTPVLLKTKRKFKWVSKRKSKVNLKEVSEKIVPALKSQQKTQTSTESHSNSDSVIDISEQTAQPSENIPVIETVEPIEKTLWKQKCMPKIEIKNPSRMSSAVKLMESSLQIIKEESQSTDSSSRKSKEKNVKELKKCESEIKETQTDFITNDVEKFKEVITYLYNTIDQKKNELVATITESKIEVKHSSEHSLEKRDSSSETSSYHEQFKNFVKNVKPKLCGSKKTSKTDIITSNYVANKPEIADSAVQSKIPKLSQRISNFANKITTKNSSTDPVVPDSLSSSGRSSSTTEPKKEKNTKTEKKLSKNFTKKRSSSVDILSSGYFEKYKSTKELIEQQRKKRAESADSCMRKKSIQIEPEFKSSTSISDFSSLVVSIKDDQSLPAQKKENKVDLKRSEEKYVQCELIADFVKDLTDKNIGTFTEEEKDKETIKSSISVVENGGFAKNSDSSKDIIASKDALLNNCQDKSLQTSVKQEEDVNVKENNENKVNILYTDMPQKISKKRMFDDLFRRMSSYSFISPRRSPTKISKEFVQGKYAIRKQDSKLLEKTGRMQGFNGVFVNNKGERQVKSNVLAYNVSEQRDIKKSCGKKIPETDYINFRKLERHLEQVVGLYPSIFKAIRAQMDDMTARKLDKQIKVDSPDLFTSNSTLATTIDTVTEYKNTDSLEKYPSFSESNLDKFNKYCECINYPDQEYQLQQFIISQNLIRQGMMQGKIEKKKQGTLHSPEHVNHKMKKMLHKMKDVTTTPYPYTDSTSTSSKTIKNKGKCHSKKSKKPSKAGMKKKRTKKSCIKSVTSVFSKDLNFASSSSSCCGENWSVASPLYSITTPSMNFSLCGHSVGRSQSSKSLVTNKRIQTQITKSKSVIEMSSVKEINRELTIQHLLETNNKMKKYNHQQNVLVVSVNSSCTVFATPSKFLSKVEKHLKQSDPKPVKEIEYSTTTKAHQENKKQIDEQSFHSLFFSDSKTIIRSPTISEQGSHRPFYIHKRKNDSHTDDEFPDSLEVNPPKSKVNEAVIDRDDDLGNFSADSLETGNSNYRKKDFQRDMKYIGSRIETPSPQNFFVYTNTVDYDRNSTQEDHKNAKSDKKEKSQQSQSTQVDQPVLSTNNGENASNSLLSESGYESTKSKRTASIRNFFKKGGSLLDIFRNSSKNKIPKPEASEIPNSNMTSFSNIWQKKQESQPNTLDVNNGDDDYVDEDMKNSKNFPYQMENTVYWSTIGSTSKKEKKTTFSQMASPSKKRDKSSSPYRNQGTHMSYIPKSSPGSDDVNPYQKQVNECHAYAEKVLLESQLRREGYYKQYQDFKEIPLELLIGRRVPHKLHHAREPSVQVKPKTKPTSSQFPPTQFSRSTDIEVMKSSETTSTAVDSIDSGESFITTNTATQQIFGRAVVFRNESPVRMIDQDIDKGIVKFQTVDRPSESNKRRTEIISSRPGIKYNTMLLQSQSAEHIFTQSNNTKDQSVAVHISRRDKFDKSKASAPKPKERQLLPEFSEKQVSTRDDLSTSKTSTRKPKEKEQSSKSNEKEEKALITKFKSKIRSKSQKSQTRSKSRDGCSCDGKRVPAAIPKVPSPTPLPREPSLSPPSESILETEPEAKQDETERVKVKEIEEVEKGDMVHEPEVPVLSSSSSTESVHEIESISNALFIHLLLEELVEEAVHESDRVKAAKKPSKPSMVQLPSLTEIEKQEIQPEILEPKSEATSKEILMKEDDNEEEEPMEICKQTSEDFRKGLTDKEVFDKLLNSFEKEDEIATRLSKDEEFFKAQIKTIKKDSVHSIDEESTEPTGTDPNEVIYSEDPIGGKHRSTHFWEEKMKTLRAKEENPVKEDDIGTCFSRGFRPDNIALSGDACFSLNKQDRLKFPKGMLTNEESIIDFSERETPLDYLLALGFMVDEASNALKDEDIRSRLLAAITEARVWINKITTTQGTLLYLVAYKSRPKTMRYFLQLVEAIINRRINNAIKLDGFLRVLEKVEEGEIQMINILGADKFEDEENEEKIVKKQLRQLFITVYKIAEKEALMKGKQLSQQAIVLLRILAAKYRAGLHPHLELIARYIGQELLNTETQLEAAMIFLSRLDTAEVKLKEFEAYCDIQCEKKKKKTPTKYLETAQPTEVTPKRAASIHELENVVLPATTEVESVKSVNTGKAKTKSPKSKS